MYCEGKPTSNRINSNNWKLRNQNKERKHWRISSAKDTSFPNIYSPIPELLLEPEIEERSSNLKDPEQVKAIYHYLLIVAGEDYSDKDRVAAAEHLAKYYFKCPIYRVDWYINEARIFMELNNTGTDIIDRTKTRLFEAVEVMEKGQTKKEAVKAVRNKLSITMLIDLLGEEWKNESRKAEIMALGFIGAGVRKETKAKRIIKESGIYRQQIIDNTNLSEFQRNVVSAIKRGMRATEYAKLFDTNPERVRKEHQRARGKMKQTLEGLNKDK